jgi:hypothetical protein
MRLTVYPADSLDPPLVILIFLTAGFHGRPFARFIATATADSRQRTAHIEEAVPQMSAVKRCRISNVRRPNLDFSYESALNGSTGRNHVHYRK